MTTLKGTGFVAAIARLVAFVIAVTATLPSIAMAQATDEVLYYHTDATGSVRMITNASQQEVVRHVFTPFGERLADADVTDVRRFAGKERDAETGFDYFGGRHYASGSGRFTTVDPGHVNGNVYDPQSWNGYAYARNNPLRYADPDGREYEICVPGGACGKVSDGYFQYLLRNPGAGITLWNGWIYATVDGRQVAAGTYRQTSVDLTFDTMLLRAGRVADRGVKASLIITSPSIVLAAGVTVGGAIAGTQMVTIGGEAGLNLLGNQALNQAIGLSQRALLRRFFLEGQVPPGITRQALELYREIARRAIAEGKDQLGVQAARLKLIEQALRQLR